MKQEKTSPCIKIDALLIPVLPTWWAAAPILPEAQRLGVAALGHLHVLLFIGPGSRAFLGAGVVPAGRQLLCFLPGPAGSLCLAHPRVGLPGCHEAPEAGKRSECVFL